MNQTNPSDACAAVSPDAVVRWAVGLLSGALLLLALSPIVQNWRSKPVDSFPLSYYPMFSENRTPTAKVSYLVGIDAAGNRHRLPYTLAGRGGLNQVRRQINRRLDRDQEDTLCRAVAEKVAKAKDWTHIVKVEIRTDTYHLGGYFTGTNRVPVRERIHGSCKVRRDEK